MGEGCGQGARSGCGGLKAGSAGGTPRTSLACPAVRPPASRPNSGTPGAPPGPAPAPRADGPSLFSAPFCPAGPARPSSRPRPTLLQAPPTTLPAPPARLLSRRRLCLRQTERPFRAGAGLGAAGAALPQPAGREWPGRRPLREKGLRVRSLRQDKRASQDACPALWGWDGPASSGGIRGRPGTRDRVLSGSLCGRH